MVIVQNTEHASLKSYRTVPLMNIKHNIIIVLRVLLCYFDLVTY